MPTTMGFPRPMDLLIFPIGLGPEYITLGFILKKKNFCPFKRGFLKGKKFPLKGAKNP